MSPKKVRGQQLATYIGDGFTAVHHHIPSQREASVSMFVGLHWRRQRNVARPPSSTGRGKKCSVTRKFRRKWRPTLLLPPGRPLPLFRSNAAKEDKFSLLLPRWRGNP